MKDEKPLARRKWRFDSRAFILHPSSLSLSFKEYPTVAYYEEDDLGRFAEVGKHRPDLFEKFMAWYQACQEDGALSRREKALIGLGVAHALQCPYCIDAFSQSCLEAGSNMEQMTEAIHMASALRGGASLVHGVQAHNSVNKVSM
jgi:alkylhydroperoxidase/carboxymuconolactone decarboxylase family protein